ncbi:MAG: hypothetical protein QNK23_02245 [Crocinitomicaceae bacterium]|nr:hypothetical protein [Crocinitomicaceae bacterium]
MMLHAVMVSGMVLSLYFAIKTRNAYIILIMLGLLIGAGTFLFSSGILQTLGLILYLGFAAITGLYALFTNKMTLGARFVLAVMAGLILVYWTWKSFHLPGSIMFVPMAVILIQVIAIIRKAELKPVLAFITLFGTDAFVVLLEEWLKH